MTRSSGLAPWCGAATSGRLRLSSRSSLTSMTRRSNPSPVPTSRRKLSWWSLLEMAPELPSVPAWSPRSELLVGQGLGMLRAAGRYVSLECGGGRWPRSSGPATPHAPRGWYSLVVRFRHRVLRHAHLVWYRSTLAHNAPRLDGRSQPLVRRYRRGVRHAGWLGVGPRSVRLADANTWSQGSSICSTGWSRVVRTSEPWSFPGISPAEVTCAVDNGRTASSQRSSSGTCCGWRPGRGLGRPRSGHRSPDTGAHFAVSGELLRADALGDPVDHRSGSTFSVREVATCVS